MSDETLSETSLELATEGAERCELLLATAAKPQKPVLSCCEFFSRFFSQIGQTLPQQERRFDSPAGFDGLWKVEIREVVKTGSHSQSLLTTARLQV